MGEKKKFGWHDPLNLMSIFPNSYPRLAVIPMPTEFEDEIIAFTERKAVSWGCPRCGNDNIIDIPYEFVKCLECRALYKSEIYAGD